MEDVLQSCLGRAEVIENTNFYLPLYWLWNKFAHIREGIKGVLAEPEKDIKSCQA